MLQQGPRQLLTNAVITGGEIIASESESLTVGLPRDCLQHVPLFLRKLEEDTEVRADAQLTLPCLCIVSLHGE